MVSGFEMRVGDAERDAVAVQLREHFATGRLTQDELNERLDHAFAAKTRGDLQAVLTDLPSAQPGWAGPAGSWAFEGAGAHRIGPGAGDGRPGGAGYGRRRGGRPAAGALAGSFVGSFVLLWAVLLLGTAGIFGIGAGRPFAIVLLFAAFALLRRLIFGIFRRRRGGWGGPRRRC